LMFASVISISLWFAADSGGKKGISVKFHQSGKSPKIVRECAYNRGNAGGLTGIISAKRRRLAGLPSLAPQLRHNQSRIAEIRRP
jgi:hypothetical protein